MKVKVAVTLIAFLVVTSSRIVVRRIKLISRIYHAVEKDIRVSDGESVVQPVDPIH